MTMRFSLGLVIIVAVLGLWWGTASADCTLTSSTGDDDVYDCDDTPPDTDGVVTGPGDDTVNLNGSTVSGSAGVNEGLLQAGDTVIDGNLTVNGPGTINNSSIGDSAIFAGGDVTVNGPVTINSTSSSNGIESGGNVTNSGNVNTTNAESIVADGNVTNSGNVNSAANTGIEMSGGDNIVTITNGSVSGGNGTAIDTQGGDDTVEISTQATINGVIDGGPGTDTIRFTGDASQAESNALNSIVPTTCSPCNVTLNGNSYSFQNFENLINALTTITQQTNQPVIVSSDPANSDPANSDPAPVVCDERINCSFGDLYAAVYYNQTNDGLDVYCINDSGAGYFAMQVTQAEFDSVGIPVANTTVEVSPVCNVAAYVLQGGTYQINIGPDPEGNVYELIFDGLANARDARRNQWQAIAN